MKRKRPGPRRLAPRSPDTPNWGEMWRERHLTPAEKRAPELDLMWRNCAGLDDDDEDEMPKYSLMSPFRLWQEVDSLGWELWIGEEGRIAWEPKMPKPMPDDLACVLRDRAEEMHQLLLTLEKKR